MHTPVCLMDYWNEVDAVMRRRFCIDTADAGISADEIAAAQKAGWSPEQYARWFGGKYDLILCNE